MQLRVPDHNITHRPRQVQLGRSDQRRNDRTALFYQELRYISLSRACIQWYPRPNLVMQSDVLSFRDIVSRLHVLQRVSGLNVRFLHQQRHTPAVLFTRVTLFLPIADCIIAFQANATKGSEYVTQLAMTEQVLYLNCQAQKTGCCKLKSTTIISIIQRLTTKTGI
ncbi:hypothetical protein FOCG_04141 [Fusarium oxysporum f. sp. radicis-lycopersici 26381]|uniref:Uncharacterized protein n=1 Tax=Fusarium oxysporum Fo47 TaxID=660027 RepID=W9JYF7_FUSOX|nr:hypothetical protein FOZG_10957 [Fusarium oxysporum Fo47]EWZ90219.1 hypothetical protein FOWG_07948 [Fusarium oxysporum f. sp. lycopersici MN25]EXL56581.1 hypothetical protein FOCG_04141 [Fusarium oxysporum f. sp. radicis-lycopersici 26381]EWZ37112.1 hypothetical protein FOZG_10957 [Fusarium oxysporum Fo47]EWZ90220.1 hypothetical protein FOWG_07948 [Fusarium oxysporum f. sp. lycopersici MN25]